MTMRLIDADALIREANSEGAYGYVDAAQIAKAPTIEVKDFVRYTVDEGRRRIRYEIIENERIKRAHWIINGDWGECSHCHEASKLSAMEHKDYCPACGAYMIEEVETDGR